jgi:hypothetical protein
VRVEKLSGNHLGVQLDNNEKSFGDMASHGTQNVAPAPECITSRK